MKSVPNRGRAVEPFHEDYDSNQSSARRERAVNVEMDMAVIDSKDTALTVACFAFIAMMLRIHA